MFQELAVNKLFYGDNLDVLRGFDDESIDLIYLDPPFNSTPAITCCSNRRRGRGRMRPSRRSTIRGHGETAPRMR